jgi:hypothetical protein
MPKRSEKGAYREQQERLWRHDKRRPRRTRIEIIQDLGRSIQKDVLTFPSYVTLEQKDIPKQRSGKWQVIWNHAIKIVKSTETGRFFVFDRHEEYLGELEGTDMYHLAVKLLNAIDAFRIHLQMPYKGKRYIRYVLKGERKILGELRGK